MGKALPNRFAFTQARIEMACPHCKVNAGQHCIMPSGKRYYKIHDERHFVYKVKIGSDEYKRRHATMAQSFGELISRVRFI